MLKVWNCTVQLKSDSATGFSPLLKGTKNCEGQKKDCEQTLLCQQLQAIIVPNVHVCRWLGWAWPWATAAKSA